LSPLCIEDAVQTVAKMKTHLLKDLASGTFLKILVEEHSKLDHGLCISDLVSKDKMNFRSAQKTSETRVSDALKSVSGSKGTKCYLMMLRGVLESFLNKAWKLTGEYISSGELYSS